MSSYFTSQEKVALTGMLSDYADKLSDKILKSESFVKRKEYEEKLELIMGCAGKVLKMPK